MNNNTSNSPRGYNPELIEVRFGAIEEKMDELKGRVDDLDKINNVLVELKYLSQQQVKDGRERDKMIERLTTSQSKQNKTLVDISNTTHQLGDRICKTEDSVDELSIRMHQEKDRGVIHINELAKNAIFVILGAVLAALVASVI